MHLFGTLLSAAALILSTNAVPSEPIKVGWRGPGLYQIVNRATRTALDLFEGRDKIGTPIYGRTLNTTMDNQVWMIARMQGDEYSLLNHEVSMAVGATQVPKPVVGKSFNFTDPSIRWKLTLSDEGNTAIFESVMFPGKVLDLDSSNPKDMTPVLVYWKYGTANQKWRLVPVDGPEEDDDDTRHPWSEEDL